MRIVKVIMLSLYLVINVVQFSLYLIVLVLVIFIEKVAYGAKLFLQEYLDKRVPFIKSFLQEYIDKRVVFIKSFVYKIELLREKFLDDFWFALKEAVLSLWYFLEGCFDIMEPFVRRFVSILKPFLTACLNTIKIYIEEIIAALEPVLGEYHHLFSLLMLFIYTIVEIREKIYNIISFTLTGVVHTVELFYKECIKGNFYLQVLFNKVSSQVIGDPYYVICCLLFVVILYFIFKWKFNKNNFKVENNLIKVILFFLFIFLFNYLD